LTALNKLRASKRDIIAHSYIWSDANVIKFINRTAQGEYKTVEYVFTLQEFKAHVYAFGKDMLEFYGLLGCESGELDAFAKAALSLDRKSKTSPGSPASSK
jgi:hypothetical protein